MHTRDSGRVHEKLVKRLERQEKQRAYQQGRFFRYKLDDIHGKLKQALMQEEIVETDNVAAFSTALKKGMKQAANSTEFDFAYFISPIRTLVPRPNPYSLYLTQYLMEVLINDPSVIEIYGTDEDVYHVINKVISRAAYNSMKWSGRSRRSWQATKSWFPGLLLTRWQRMRCSGKKWAIPRVKPTIEKTFPSGKMIFPVLFDF
jgi:hypothetical protein